MKLIGKIVIWFAGEVIIGTFSDIIATQITNNPFLHPMLFALLFGIFSIVETYALFKTAFES